MSLVLLIARLLLTVVFLVAGIAKLADLKGSQQAMRDFGVPAQLATPLGTLLPLAELVVAVALLFPIFAWWAGVGALLLLVALCRRYQLQPGAGRQPDCHCFGQLHSAPAGWPTLIRNLVLAAVAVVILVLGRSTPELGVLDWLAPLTLFQRIEVLGGVVLLALLHWRRLATLFRS